MKRRGKLFALLLGVLTLLSACAPDGSPAASALALASADPSPTSMPSPTSTSEPTTQPTNSPTNEPTSVAPTPPSLPPGWTEVASFDGEALNLTDLTYGSGRFVAVGSDQEGPGARVRGRVWVSSVGSSWELLPVDPVFDLAYLTNVVTAADGRHLIFGRIEDASGGSLAIPHAVWESADGLSWRRIDLGLPADLGSVNVVVGPAGYLLNGIRFGAGRDELWLSPDGRQWELVRELPPRNGPVYEDITRLAAGAEGFVAAGFRDSAPYIIASADGREWFEAPDQPVLDQIGVAPRIAAIGGEWVIPHGNAVWHSPDGLNWEASGTMGGVGYDAALASTGADLFLTMASPAGMPGVLPTGVWSSVDGRAWERADLPAEAYVVLAAVSEDVIVLAGYAPADEQRSTFWVRLVSDR